MDGVLTNGKQVVYNGAKQRQIEDRCRRIRLWLDRNYQEVLAPDKGHLRILWEGAQIKVFIGRGDKIE